MTNKADSQLKQDVSDELRLDPSVGGAELDVTANDGVITLRGTTDSYAQKVAALAIVERVPGVRTVADDIIVAVPNTRKRTDTDTAHIVTALLRWNVIVPANRIKVGVEDGWVTLEGETDWQFQRSAAEQPIATLAGVRGVTNRIVVKNAASAPGARLRIA